MKRSPERNAIGAHRARITKTRRGGAAAGTIGIAAALAVLLTGIRGDTAPARQRERPAARRLIQAGAIPYVIGSLPGRGQIVGGGHRLLIPSAPGREPIDAANQPSRLHPDLQGAALVFDPRNRGGSSSSPAFPSSWWPQQRNGVADRWNSANKNYEDLTSDPDNLAPTEKYDLLFYPGQRQRLPEVRSWTMAEMRRPAAERGAPSVQPAITVAGPATQWELSHHGVYQSIYPESWWGHCNGWAAYVSTEPGGAPRRDVRVKIEGGAVTECAPGEARCVRFRMADIEALMTELYFNISSTASGRRCSAEPDKMRRDEFGRPIDPACRDLNPATMHVAMTGLLGTGVRPLSAGGGVQRRPVTFLLDHAMDWEVWAYPVVRFSIDEIEEVSGPEAMRLVCAGHGAPADCRSYRFNENATRFARVKARAWIVLNGPSGAWLLVPAAQRRERVAVERLNYVLEMNGAGRILGGEWIKDPSSNIDGKKVHPDFLWLPVRAQGYGEDADDRGGTGDNPYVSYSKVRAILDVANRAPRNR